MALPRMIALAEVLWSPAASRDWRSFQERLVPRLRALDRLGVNYRISAVQGLEADRLSLEPTAVLRLRTLRPDAVIRYTLDGTSPHPASATYHDSLVVQVGTPETVVTARAFLPDGSASPLASAAIRRTTLRPAVQIEASSLAPGVSYQVFEGRLRNLGRLGELDPSGQGVWKPARHARSSP